MKKIKIADVKIRKSYMNTKPSRCKLVQRADEIGKYGRIPPITIDEEGYLCDGYCNYLIAKYRGKEKIRYKNRNRSL